MTTATSTFARFTDQQNVLLTTYRRDGTAVGTPVHIAVEGDRAYFRTWDTTWKLKRIRNNPEVEIAPSDIRGNPTGPTVRARARILSGAESKHAAVAIAGKYPILHGIVIPLIHRVRRNKTMHVELRPLV